MNRVLVGWGLVLCVIQAGCFDRDCFTVQITPKGDAIHRKLTCWHEGSGEESERSALSGEELSRLKTLYGGRQTPDGAVEHVFEGRFRGDTPADVGGAGSYKHVATSLGSLSIYVERFRGDDDLEARLARKRAAADQLTDLVIGWAELELGDVPNFDRLREFLDKDFRQDLKNIGLYAWYGGTSGTGSAAEPPPYEGALVRVGQYLIERGYLGPKDLPTLARATALEDADLLLPLVQRFLAGKLEIPDGRPLPEPLLLLTDSERLGRSWNRYLESTDAYKQRLVEWEEAKKTDPDAGKPPADEVLDTLVAEALFSEFFGNLFGTPDTLEVKLLCRHEPLSTNGAWDADSGAVTWSADLREQISMPVLCFAFWSEPDRTAQENLFGEVILDGESLGSYALWHAALTQDESSQWDRLLAGCQPGPGLVDSIRSFAFSGDNPDLAQGGTRLLLQGLGVETEDQP